MTRYYSHVAAEPSIKVVMGSSERILALMVGCVAASRPVFVLSGGTSVSPMGKQV